MKKILISVMLVLALLCPVFCFAGCGDENEFWQNTYNNLNQFLTNEDYAFLIDSNNFDYSDLVVSEKSQASSEYYCLDDIYGFALGQFMGFVNVYAQALNVKPLQLATNSGKVKKVYGQFDKQLEQFTAATNEFISTVAAFKIASSDSVNDTITLQKFKEFKRDYYSYLAEVQAFAQSFEDLYLTSYQSLDFDSETLPNGIQKLANDVLLADCADMFFELELVSTQGVSTVSISQNLKYYIALFENNRQKTANSDIQKYKTFKTNFDLYKTNLKNYYSALENISYSDYAIKYAFSEESYLQEYSEHKIYLQTITDFDTFFANISYLTNDLFA